MKKRKMNSKTIMVFLLAFLLGMSLLTGCGKGTAGSAVHASSGGVLLLKVNPEIAVTYDEKGNVTKVDGRNEDGVNILKDYKGFEGKPARDVMVDLVNAIGKAGYFVEEIEGRTRQITIEIEKGSKLPDRAFMDGVIAGVRESVLANHWRSPVEVRGESDYGITDYADTDYGPDNDGVTDYNDKNTDYGPGSDGVTDYNDKNTDYGPNSDGVTDYNDKNTDYGPNSDGVTDYNDKATDYNDHPND